MSDHRHRFLFSRRFKINRQEGFSKLLQQKPITNRWFAIYSNENSSGCSRLGLTVGKRIVPGAVQRNRVKRKIRECFRLQASDCYGQDVIVRLRKSFDKTEQSLVFSTLAETLARVLAKK